MTGSSAAALTGLMFIVITLLAQKERQHNISTVSTLTVLHFAAALLISANLVAPWRSLLGAGVLVAILGIVGIGYQFRLFAVAREAARHETDYVPDLSDRIWYTILPLAAYAALAAGAFGLVAAPGLALFVVAAAVISLIFIGIRNAWDLVTFITVGPGS
ncbi:MAG: hypothetical protein JO101_07240 [Candidatus Eremiobacteraeota bacterium]|nr:hypothetical protein [Candidatus Eremiobacteraeota bacterium]MBV8355099.1 hypothetical protein [Candidatus Eremiobacteraeota bacterium]